MEPEEKEEEQKKVGATSALPKITTAGYASLDVRESVSFLFFHILNQPRIAHSVLHVWS